ncbi:hypothetical protein PENNAL_c0229G09771, partial [Penicillium nalgiovense]
MKIMGHKSETKVPLSFHNLSGRLCEDKEPSGGHSVRN